MPRRKELLYRELRAGVSLAVGRAEPSLEGGENN